MHRLTTALLLLALPVLSVPASAAESITGHATVVDGDTIELQGKRVQLFGIDAPETAQSCEQTTGRSYRCGQAATAALRGLIGTDKVVCEPREIEPKSLAKARLTAVCRVGVEDLSAWMVSHGHALANRGLGPAYAQQERHAWATRRGIWSGTFEEPADWRRVKQRAEVSANPAAAD